MTDAKLAELKATAKQILTHHRLQLLNKHPFIGTIAMNLELIPIRDARCNTAMTDGKAVYFDIDFLSRLNENEIQFVLGHEIWHVVMLHFLRRNNREMRAFNIATDMEVNQILSADGFIPPADAIFPNRKFSKKCSFNFDEGLSAEEYYDLLLEQNAKKNNNENSSEKMSAGENGNSTSPLDKHFDKDINQQQELEDAMNNGASDKYGKKAADEDYQPTTISNESAEREAGEKIREMIVSASQIVERSRGELPAYIKKYVDKLLESKISWKEQLAAFITKGFENRTNWNTPNRRFAYQNTYLPSHTGDMLRLAIGIDTSGSCEKDCEQFLSEINAITKSFDSYKMHVLQCDTEIKAYNMFDEYSEFDPKSSIEFTGFGGTKLHPIFDYINLNELDADVAVIFTDGECERFSIDDNIDIPILWVITGKNKCKNLEIGEKTYMNNK